MYMDNSQFVMIYLMLQSILFNQVGCRKLSVVSHLASIIIYIIYLISL